MIPRLRFLIAGLIGLSLAGAPAITAAASTWCPKTLQEACSCCHQQGQEQGCQIRCAQPPIVSTVTSSSHVAFPRLRTAHVSSFTNLPAVSNRAASTGPLASDVTHAPPLKRYLLACTFRL